MDVSSSMRTPLRIKALIFMMLLIAAPLVPATGTAQDDFIRGDCLGDGDVGLGDLVWMMCVFCDPGPASCYDACDADDDGVHNIPDVIYLMSYLFEDGLPPPAPFQVCGPDPTADGLTCVNYQYDCQSGSSLPPFEPGYTMWIPDASGAPGETISTAVNLEIDDSGVTMSACSFGVSHDQADLTFINAQQGIDVATADFWSFQIHDGGWSCFTVLSFVGMILYSQGSYELATAEYQVLGEVGESTSLQFVDTLGDPPTRNRVVASWGPESIPTTVDGSVSVTQPFRRGDTNDDGVIDIGDPVWSLSCIFLCFPGCFDAHDTNDDGQWNIADPIYCLMYLFTGGSPPPAPFPQCGSDPTPDPIACESYSSCP